jgi:hypothetical protein
MANNHSLIIIFLFNSKAQQNSWLGTPFQVSVHIFLSITIVDIDLKMQDNLAFYRSCKLGTDRMAISRYFTAVRSRWLVTHRPAAFTHIDYRFFLTPWIMQNNQVFLFPVYSRK